MVVNVAIPSGISERTHEEVVHDGKIYIVEVKAKLKDTTPWKILYLMMLDCLIGLAYLWIYFNPSVETPPPSSVYSVEAVILGVAFLLLIIVGIKSKKVQETVL